VLHNDRPESKPVLISYKRTSIGSLFSGDTGTVNVSEKLSFELIPLTEDVKTEPFTVYANGEAVEESDQTSFPLTFEQAGTIEVFVDSDQIVALNTASFEVLEFDAFEVNLRIEGPKKTIFSGKAEVKPATASVNQNGVKQDFYLENSVLTPAVNVLNQQAIPFTLNNDTGLIVESINGVKKGDGLGWFFLRNHGEIEFCASLQEVEKGDGIILYWGLPNSEPLELQHNGLELDQHQSLPGTFVAISRSQSGVINAADVYVDNKLFGRTNSKGEIVLSLGAGQHKIKAFREGFINTREYTVGSTGTELEIVPYAVVAVLLVLVLVYWYKKRE